MTHFHGDFSNHDWTRGVMDVASMAADGVEGGFHKFADGLYYYMDPYFPEAARRMRASSFKFWGCYHVVWGSRDPAAQADWQIALLDDQVPGWRTDPRFRLMSDNEKFVYQTAPSIAQINAYHDRWAQRVPGVVQLAYAPRWYYGSSVTGIRYPVVASNYGSNPAVHYPLGYPGDGSSRWADSVLQYGSLLRQGTQNTTDCNAVKDDALWALLVGDDMPFLDDPNAAALAYRMDALESGSDAVRGGPTKDEPMWLVTAVKDVQAKVTAAGGLSAADRALLQQVVDSNAALKASVDALNSRLATP